MNNRPHWADTAIAIFTGLMLVTYITGNYFSCQQMKLTKRAIEQAERDNGASITAQKEIAQQSLTVSQQNFEKSAQATAEQFRLDQRAWVADAVIAGVPEVNKPFWVTVTIKNTGKTFAKGLTVAGEIKSVAKGQPPDFSYESKTKRTGVAVLAPNGETVISFYPIGHSATTDKMTQPMMDDLKLQTVYVSGRIDYQDIFACKRWTTFCYFLDPRDNYRGYSHCKTHNDADNNHCSASR